MNRNLLIHMWEKNRRLISIKTHALTLPKLNSLSSLLFKPYGFAHNLSGSICCACVYVSQLHFSDLVSLTQTLPRLNWTLNNANGEHWAGTKVFLTVFQFLTQSDFLILQGVCDEKPPSFCNRCPLNFDEPLSSFWSWELLENKAGKS